MDFILPLIVGFSCATVFFLYINGYFNLLFIIIRNYNNINETINELNITPDILMQYASMFNNKNIFNILMQYVSMFNNKNILNIDSSTKQKKKTYISKNGKCIHIYYDYEGTEYLLTVPYNRSSLVDMIQYQIDAIYENEDIVTITQQPGIPYLISSKDLNCKMLKAINHETDVYHKYEADIKPLFCQEICDI